MIVHFVSSGLELKFFGVDLAKLFCNDFACSICFLIEPLEVKVDGVDVTF